MVKELENLNDFVDGYLIAVYDEPDGTLKNGKTEFLENFRNQLAVVPSSKEGNELVKAINRGIIQADKLPKDASLNSKRGFEEAKVTIQNKIKELFSIEDTMYGTIAAYLQDIPKVALPGKLPLPTSASLFSGGNIQNAVVKLKELEVNMLKNMDQRIAVFDNHMRHNGRIILISDEGYSEIMDDTGDILPAIIESTRKSKSQLKIMVERFVAVAEAGAASFENGKSDEGDDLF